MSRIVFPFTTPAYQAEIEIEFEYSISPAERPTRSEPGCPASAEFRPVEVVSIYWDLGPGSFLLVEGEEISAKTAALVLRQFDEACNRDSTLSGSIESACLERDNSLSIAAYYGDC